MTAAAGSSLANLIDAFPSNDTPAMLPAELPETSNSPVDRAAVPLPSATTGRYSIIDVKFGWGMGAVAIIIGGSVAPCVAIRPTAPAEVAARPVSQNPIAQGLHRLRAAETEPAACSIVRTCVEGWLFDRLGVAEIRFVSAKISENGRPDPRS
jgi:hypothetical protein